MNLGRMALTIGMALTTVSAYSQDPVTARRSSPPRELKRVEHPAPHYTPYSIPGPEQIPGDVQVHVIVKGDTLWDLALTYLGDNYYWPQMWEVNRYITDPRWIYPGDPLVIPRPLTIAEIPPPPEEFIDFASMPSPEPAGKRFDVYCSTSIVTDSISYGSQRGGRALEPEASQIQTHAADGDTLQGVGGQMLDWETATFAPPEKLDISDVPWQQSAEFLLGPPRIVANEYGLDRVALSSGDTAFINRGMADGVKAGEEFFILRPGRDVYHPDTQEFIGVAVTNVGKARVLCTQEQTATVLVEDVCGRVLTGDTLKPYEEIPIPLISEFHPSPKYCEGSVCFDEGEDKISGTVVFARDDRISVAEEDTINVDIGTDSGIAPGDFLVIYRPHPSGALFPHTVMGDAVVLMVNRDTALTKIMYSRNPVIPGDHVVLR